MKDLPKDIVAVALFGSRARTDADSTSDKDVLAVVTATSLARFREIEEVVAVRFGCQSQDVSIYTRSACERMAASGAPFMHHLVSESQVLFDPYDFLSDCFRNVRPCTGYKGQLGTYEELLQIVQSNHDTDEGLTECDLHLLHMLLRNICILLCLHRGQPTFGRTSPIYAIASSVPEIQLPNDLDQLTAWALAYSRNVHPHCQFPQKAAQTNYVMAVANVLSFAKGELYNSRD